MKNGIITLFLLLLFITCYSQNSRYEYRGRFTPTIKKEKLTFINFINEITPELWRKLALPYKERFILNQVIEQQKIVDYPQDNYNKIIDLISVEILTTCAGKSVSFISPHVGLTAEQKNILNAADLGSDINIKISFKFKNNICAIYGIENTISQGKISVTIIPETEAEYPGGIKLMSEYIIENFINKIPDSNSSVNSLQATVHFTVNEEGHVVDIKLLKSSTDSKIDEILLSAINKMPKWKPAENSMGIKVKQEFSIPFGGGC